MASKVTVEIQNSYEDGHESTHRVELDCPPEGIDFEVELPGWFENVVFEHTGDGHGKDGGPSGGYIATIVEAPKGREGLIGEWFEWV